MADEVRVKPAGESAQRGARGGQPLIFTDRVVYRNHCVGDQPSTPEGPQGDRKRLGEEPDHESVPAASRVKGTHEDTDDDANQPPDVGDAPLGPAPVAGRSDNLNIRIVLKGTNERLVASVGAFPARHVKDAVVATRYPPGPNGIHSEVIGPRTIMLQPFADRGLKRRLSGADNDRDPMNPLLRLVATVAIVAMVAFASRSAPSDAAASAESVRCEVDPPRDVAGLEACLSRFPRDLELLVELGAAYEAAERLDDARSAYRRALEIDPRDAEVQRHLAGLPQ